VRRAYRNGRIKCTKTEASLRAVPLQALALVALEQLPTNDSAVLFPSPRGGHLDLHNFRNRDWKPAQQAARIMPLRRVYDLRHTFATFALRAGISTFDLSRYMGASLTMIDRHYGHLARDGRDHAIHLLDAFTDSEAPNVHAVDAAWTSDSRPIARPDNGKRSSAGINQKPSDGLEPSTPSLPSAHLSRFGGCRICDRLPPVAPAWLQKMLHT